MESQLSLFEMMFNAEKEVEVEEVNTKITEPIKNLEKKIIKKPLNREKKTFIVGEAVRVSYFGEIYLGVVKSIYNNNETINCIFDGGTKHTAFYIDSVFKLD